MYKFDINQRVKYKNGGEFVTGLVYCIYEGGLYTIRLDPEFRHLGHSGIYTSTNVVLGKKPNGVDMEYYFAPEKDLSLTDKTSSGSPLDGDFPMGTFVLYKKDNKTYATGYRRPKMNAFGESFYVTNLYLVQYGTGEMGVDDVQVSDLEYIPPGEFRIGDSVECKACNYTGKVIARTLAGLYLVEYDNAYKNRGHGGSNSPTDLVIEGKHTGKYMGTGYWWYRGVQLLIAKKERIVETETPILENQNSHTNYATGTIIKVQRQTAQVREGERIISSPVPFKGSRAQIAIGYLSH